MRTKTQNKKSAETTKCWLTEMRETILPELIDGEEIHQRLEGQIKKCYTVVENFQTNSMFFLLDNINFKYLFVSKSTESVLGYNRDEVVAKGFQWLFTLFSEEELQYKKEIMSDVFSFLKTLGPEKVLNCVVRYDLVVKRKDGKEIHVLEEMMFPEVNKNGEPLMISAFVHDIDVYGTSNERKCSILLKNQHKTEEIFSKKYLIFKKDSPLSYREREVLREFSNGLTTTQVSKKLFVSANTVKTHRKNILFKLNAQNTIEAIKICSKNSWLT